MTQDDPNSQTNSPGILPTQQGGVSGKNPLDELEELIKNAQSRAGDSQNPTPLPDQLHAEEAEPEIDEAAQWARVEELKQQKEIEEKELVKQQQELIQQIISDSEQTQLRAEAKADEAAERGIVPDGMMIRQLDHTKIKSEDQT
ncbi:MAG TPA: hypothetical protein PLM16_00335 [Candidatus Woesebacteria bacterium]|nr:hypothetical protein [Candidatus Woesebacteria bacterium]